jgi:molecular chaperone GrpE
VPDEEKEPQASEDAVAEAVSPDGKAPAGAQPEAEPDAAGGEGAVGEPVPDAEAAEAEPAAEPTVDWQAVAEERYQQILRLRADFENFRRRVEREREEFRGIVIAEILRDFLRVYDNLERAVQAVPAVPEAEAWRAGIEMTRRGFLEVLKAQGVEPVPTVGEAFDPSMHEAIGRVADPSPEGTVVEEVQAGFRWRSRVLRAALVRVSAGPASEDTPPSGGPDEAEPAVSEG